MKKLLVGSIFANDSDLQAKYLELQLRYLACTTNDYDHVVFLSSGDTTGNFNSSNLIIPQDTSLTFWHAHLNGLKSLLSYFLEKKNDYENFLILDGDAFPIKKNWISLLLSKMNPKYLFDNQGNCIFTDGNEYEIAIALRSENLETRLHASVLFIKSKYINYVDFDYSKVGYNLWGKVEKDICLPTYQFQRRNLAFPLIRTNKQNVHPLACGVYYDCFYHHAAGSRDKIFHGNSYWDSYIPNKEDWTQQMFENPNKFISNLAGWNVSLYG